MLYSSITTKAVNVCWTWIFSLNCSAPPFAPAFEHVGVGKGSRLQTHQHEAVAWSNIGNRGKGEVCYLNQHTSLPLFLKFMYMYKNVDLLVQVSFLCSGKRRKQLIRMQLQCVIHASIKYTSPPRCIVTYLVLCTYMCTNSKKQGRIL